MIYVILCFRYLDKPEFCWMKSKYKYDFEMNHFDVEIKENEKF